jgi:hypothetical protein
MKNYALFSQNGRFIGFTNFKPTNGLYKEMPDSFDPTLNVYVGDYETGELKDISTLQPRDYREANVDKKWVLLESEMNREAGTVITEQYGYQIFKQLNVIMDVLNKNSDKIQLTPEFTEMYDKIQEVRFNVKASVESYKEAPKANVVTKEEERLFIEKYTQQQLNIKDEPVILNPGLAPQ